MPHKGTLKQYSLFSWEIRKAHWSWALKDAWSQTLYTGPSLSVGTGLVSVGEMNLRKYLLYTPMSPKKKLW